MSQSGILAWLAARPGEWHDIASIASALGIHEKSAESNVRALMKHREVEYRILSGRGGKREYRTIEKYISSGDA
jgi:hypothetical protein